MYLKKLGEKNENPRYAASKNGSIVGGLICGMNLTKKIDDDEEPASDKIDDIQ